MSLIKPKNTEETILSLLQNGEKKATSIISEIKSSKRSATKQGVYAALRKLKAEEVVVIYKGIVALNTAWIREMRHAVDHMGSVYGNEKSSFNFLSLENKESVLYSFSNTLHLDAFWGHAQSLLVNATSRHDAVYAYNPHYWFYIARRNTERKLLEDMINQKRQFLMTVEGNAKLDEAIRSDFTNEYVQYAFKKLYDRPEYYVSAIGDYMIEVFLDRKIAQAIERIYKKHHSISKEVMREFEVLLQTRARNRIKISRNEKKAEILRKKLAKNFFVKK